MQPLGPINLHLAEANNGVEQRTKLWQHQRTLVKCITKERQCKNSFISKPVLFGIPVDNGRVYYKSNNQITHSWKMCLRRDIDRQGRKFQTSKRLTVSLFAMTVWLCGENKNKIYKFINNYMDDKLKTGKINCLQSERTTKRRQNRRFSSWWKLDKLALTLEVNNLKNPFREIVSVYIISSPPRCPNGTPSQKDSVI